MPADYWELAWRQTWQVTLLAAAIASLVALCGRNRPHLAHALWLAVLLKCLTPPLWSSTLGLFCWLQPASVTTDAEPAVQPSIRITMAADEHQEVDLDAVSQLLPDDFPLNSESPLPTLDSSAAAAVTPPSVPTPLWPTFLPIAAGLWLCGCLVWLTKTVVRSIACWKTIRAATVPATPELLQVLNDLIRRLQIRRSVRLVVSATRIGPAVVGLLRPTIVLPEIIVAGRPASELEPILAHELIHVRRGDLWVGCLQTLTCGVWWFHPLVRGVCRALAREAERCVDEELIAELRCDPAHYARTLLTVLELKQTLRPVPVFPGMKPVEITSKRLERIMSLRQGCRNRTPWWCWATLTAVLAATLPGQALVAVGQQPAPQEQNPKTRVERIERYYDVPDLVEKFARWDGNSDKQALENLIARLPWHRNLIDVEDVATLRILAPAAAHNEIAAMLRLWREAPFDQVIVRLAILNVPLDQVDSLLRTAEDNPLVERQAIGRPQTLADSEVETFWTEVRQAKGSEILSRPQIRTVNGQASHIEVGQEGAYVTGYEETAEGEAKPQVTKVREGLRMDVLPKVQADGSFEIATTVELKTVTDVKRSTVVIAGKEEPVEQPIMSVAMINVTAKVGPERTMVLKGPVQKRPGEQAMALVMLLKSRPIGPPPKAPTPVVPPRAETRPGAGQKVSFTMGTLDGGEPSAAKTPGPLPLAIDFGFPLAGEEAATRTEEASQPGAPARVTAMSAKGDHRELSLAGDGWTLKIYAQAKGDRPAVLDFDSRDGRTKVTGSGTVRLELKTSAAKTPELAELQLQANSVQIEEFAATVLPNPTALPQRELRLALQGHVALLTPKARCTCGKADLRANLPTDRDPQNGARGMRIHAQLSEEVRLIQTSPSAGPILEAEHLIFSVVGAGELEILPGKDNQKRVEKQGTSKLQTRTYPVADLVVPIPTSVKLAIPSAESSQTTGPEPFLFNNVRNSTPVSIASLSDSDGGVTQATAADDAVSAQPAKPVEQAGSREAKAARDRQKLGLQSLRTLRKLIQATVAPDSWSSRAGGGEIAVYEPTLSLVIRQTPEIHEQIAELFSKLHREQDVQVSLELKLIRFTDHGWTNRLKWPETAEKLVEGITLSSDKAAQFQKLDEVIKNDHRSRFPKLTLFNEQVAEFLLPLDGDKSAKPLALAMGIVVNPDRRGLRLNLACNVTNREEALSGARSFRLADGESLLIDLGPEATAAKNVQEIPVLTKIPHVGRLFKYVQPQANPDQPAQPLMLLVIPRIIVMEEEVELRPAR